MADHSVKIGRNQPCPCGSGKKYKKCCALDDSISQETIQASYSRLAKTAKGDYGSNVLVLEDQLPLKMSEVIADLADELLGISRTQHQIKVSVALACAAWNLALFSSHEEQESAIDELFFAKLNVTADEMLRPYIYAMIDKKHRDYPHVKRIITDYEVLFSHDNYRLNVASIVSKEELPTGQDIIGVI